MWRRIYIVLLLVRLYFALSPSYLHPDENFQGPEVIAGMPPCRPTFQIPDLEVNQAIYRRSLWIPYP